MAKKFKSFTEAKNRLLYITKKLNKFWVNENKPSVNELAVALDVFVNIVNSAEELAFNKQEKDLIKQIRSFFVPEEELAVLLLMVVAGVSITEADLPKYEKKTAEIMKRYISPGNRSKRLGELNTDLKKIEAILLQ